MTFNYFISYFVILFLATIVPGPSMLLALNHGANHGAVKSVYSGFGNLIGNLIMALVSILGLGVLLVSSGIVFNIIKWAGIIYLVFIGLNLIFNSTTGNKANHMALSLKNKKNHKLFFDGFFIAIGNPKGILFFTALFPQFIDIKTASFSSFVIIFSTLAIVAFGCFMLYAVFGVQLNSLFQQKKFRKIFNRITGSLFLGMGLTLVFSKK